MKTGTRDRQMVQFTLVALNLLVSGICPLNAATPKEYGVQVQATVAVSPPSITLSWALESRATGYVIQRKLYTATTNWGAAVTLTGTATGWADTTVNVGTQYEYQVTRYSTITSALGSNLTSSGCISAGIAIPPVDRRGTLILVVDDTMATPLASELTRLRDDLLGDGWGVIRHDVSRTAAVTAIKALIKTDYEAAPAEVKSVFLFGHIPVPLSGADAPGGHNPNHFGAFPADVFYGEMDGVWTDTLVNSTVATSPWTACWNIPGDGKFDQTRPPTRVVELEVGRVDLSNMPAFQPKTEADLLRQYLDKDHAHRHATRVLPRRALISDEMGEQGGNAYAFGAWRAWTSWVGDAQVSAGLFGSLQTNSYLAYARFGGGDTRMCGTIFTSDFASQDPQAAFFMMFGSHFSDWNYTDNILRAPLCITAGLASVYSGYPFWLLHRMALGGTIGESARLTQNNGFLDAPDDITTWWGSAVFYQPQTSKAGGCHITLMGDPTLRLHAVKPVTNVAAVSGTGSVAINWTASVDTVVGYHVYRSAKAHGPFARISSNVVASTNFTDETVTAGTNTYMIRAIKLESSAGGTYYNSSQGVFVTITYVPHPPPPSNLTATAADAAVALSWTAALGAASYNVKRSLLSGGPFAAVATGITATNYLDTGLSNGTTYFYVIAAEASGEESTNSSQASATPRSAFEVWQITYFDSVTCAEAAATADPDSDGMTNEQEYLAGTNPIDPGSKLRITAIQLSGGDVVLQFNTVTGKRYRVECNTDAGDNFTNLVPDNIPGTDGPVEVTDHAATELRRRFYRIALQLP